MYKINYENLKKGFIPNIMILGIGIFLVIIFAYALFQGTIKKVTMDLDGEVEAYEVVVKHRTIRGNRKDE